MNARTGPLTEFDFDLADAANDDIAQRFRNAEGAWAVDTCNSRPAPLPSRVLPADDAIAALGHRVIAWGCGIGAAVLGALVISGRL